MQYKKYMFIFFILNYFIQIYTQRVYILVHGTWSTNASWHSQEGGFFKILSTSIKKTDRIISFRWSGGMSHKDRISAGKQLAQLIVSYPENIEIIVIAHSHGGNVVNIASQQIALYKNSKQKIHIAYILGTPIQTESYNPNMDYIDYLYNIFSFEDMVQPVMGIFQRIYPTQARICNLNIFINGKEPGHSELYKKTVAQWIGQLHEHLLSNVNEKALFSNPGTVYFSKNKSPEYKIDLQRTEKLERDVRIQIAIANFPVCHD